MAIERIRSVKGTALPLRGDNIDTDRIIPARFLRSVSFAGLEDHLFEDDRQQAGSTHPLSNPAYSAASIMFVESNFGCGSSREHAPQAIRRRGILAVVGVSFSEIFFGNSVALGLPCAWSVWPTAGRLIEAAETAIDGDRLRARPRRTLDARRGWLAIPSKTIPAAARESFLSGTWDATGLLLEDYEEVEEAVGRLPYVTGWRGRSARAS